MAFGDGVFAVGNVALRDIFRFPLWWYTQGIVHLLHSLRISAKKQFASLGIEVWVRNLFVPMYGQYDWQGRIMSFFVRLVQSVARLVAYGIWVGILACFGCMYVLVPIILLTFFALHVYLLL